MLGTCQISGQTLAQLPAVSRRSGRDYWATAWPEPGTIAAARCDRVSSAGGGGRPVRRGGGDFDHVQKSGLAHFARLARTGPSHARQQADRRLKFFIDCWRQIFFRKPLTPQPSPHGGRRDITGRDLAPQYAVPGPAGLTSSFSRAGYLWAVERAISTFAPGDIFQVNLAQRLLFPARRTPSRCIVGCGSAPATFAGYFDLLGEFQIASARPEAVCKFMGRKSETRPIKGTRQRTARPEADLFAGDDLLASEKDRAENVMIVDCNLVAERKF